MKSKLFPNDSAMLPNQQTSELVEQLHPDPVLVMKKYTIIGFFVLAAVFLLYPARTIDLLVEDGVLAPNHQCITVYSHPWHGFGDGYHFFKGNWSDLSPNLLGSHTYEKFTTATPQQFPQVARMVERLYQIPNCEPIV